MVKIYRSGRKQRVIDLTNLWKWLTENRQNEKPWIKASSVTRKNVMAHRHQSLRIESIFLGIQIVHNMGSTSQSGYREISKVIFHNINRKKNKSKN